MSGQAAIERTGRVLELDAVRAFAALSLMLFHFTHVYQVKYGYTPPLGFDYPFGKYGTQLFFMLSGYVNAMTLLAKGQPVDFLVARAIRIVPTYLLVIGLNLLLLLGLPFSLHGVYSWDQVAANLSLMPNLLGYECLEPVTWTLQVEVLFYGYLLLLFCCGGLKRPVRAMFWALAVYVVCTRWLDHVRAELPGTEAMEMADFWESLLLLPQLPLFVMGLLLYQVRAGAGKLTWNLAGLAAAFVVYHWIDQEGHNPAATLLLLSLLTGAGWGVLPLLRWRPLVLISAVSYPLFLFHNNLGTALVYYLNQAGVPSLLCFVLAIGFACVIATAVTHWFERPVSAALRAGWKNLQQRWEEKPDKSSLSVKTTISEIAS